MKYSENDLHDIIMELLAKGHEGEYWDYKREWPPKEENTDLVKDIICFANTSHSKDCFLIFGAEDDGTPHAMTRQRRNQNELNTLLSQPLKWAGGNQPIVSLETMEIKGNTYDIVIVYDSDKTPYYLEQDYAPDIKYPSNATNEDKKNVDERRKRKTLRQGVIYVRTGDNTTPFERIANPLSVENLWKKRFHLLVPAKEQFIEAMAIPENWFMSDDIYYDVYRPEFTLRPVQELSPFTEYYVQLFPDREAYSLKYSCNCRDTSLFPIHTVLIDGARWQIPYPKVEIFNLSGQRYYYFYEESDFMISYKFFNRDCSDAPRYYKTLTEYVLCLKDENEHLEFKQWVQNNQSAFGAEYKKTVESLTLHFTSEQFQNEAIFGKTLVNMLCEFRRARARI